MSRGRIVAFVLALVVAVAMGLALRDVIAPPDSTPSTPSSPASPAGPPTSLPQGPGAAPVQGSVSLPVRAADGRTVDLATPSGKLRIVHFWATWCPPCVEELPTVVAWAREAGKNPNVELFAVAVDVERKDVDDFLKRTGSTGIPSYFDPDGRTAHLLGTDKFPETWFLGPDGAILGHWIGAKDWSDPANRAEIARMSGRKG